jgi:preprotein translocase subunit SecF
VSSIDDNGASTPELPRGSSPAGKLAKRPSKLSGLYTGTGAFDIVGKAKRWYIIFGLLMLVCLVSIVFRWFNLGIEFEGGTRIQLPAQGANGTISTEQVTEVFNDTLNKEPATVQTVGTGAAQSIQIKSETLNADEVNQLKAALFEEFQPRNNTGASDVRVISDSAVSGSWGGEISQQALIALAVFLVLVTVFLAFYFERWMAVAALAALVHDIVVTAGVYSIIGFEVTPATVIGLLTILGFSLYDTMVVFDKVHEVEERFKGRRLPYADVINVATNNVLMRSLNTSIAAVLPVLSLLILGSGILGATALREFALALLVGLIAGAYSSLFIAAPVNGELKNRDPRFKPFARTPHRTGQALEDLVVATVSTGQQIPTGGPASDGSVAPAVRQPAGPALSHPPRPRKKKRR